MMQNNWTLWIFRCFPFLILLVFTVLQYSYIERTLQSNRDLTDKQYEILKERMREDNLPFEVQDHISYVATNASFNTQLLVSSLSTMQVAFQSFLFILFYSFYLTMLEVKPKKEAEPYDQ